LSPCWYESKDSSIQRLANRIPTHPLLGIRQLNDQTSATWKSLININLPQHAFLKDHKIQDAILFPAVAYLELATAACHQLLSSKDDEQQPTIIFEDVNFTKALILNEHELVEVFTQIIMPMREWYIYSRPWSAAGPDCMRPSGMTCTDVVDSFRDQNNLNKYSLNEFTLHARGKIEIDFKEQKSLTIPSINTINDTWTTQDITSAYAHLSTRGYQYGSNFQKIKTLRGTSSTVISELSNDDNDCSSFYLFHPFVMDSAFHPFLVILPGIETTFLPVHIQKFTYSSKIKTKLNQSTNVEVRGKYHDNICGIGQEGTYSFDLWIFPMDNKIEEPIFTFESIIIQQIQGIQSGRWSMEKTIYDKLNLTTDLPNADHKPYLDTIIKDYCMKRVWSDSPIIKDISHLLPSPNQILNNQLNSISNQDLIESIEPFNELAAYYAQMAIKDLNLNQQHHPLLNVCRSLTSILHSEQVVTWHSTQLHLIQLIERFPRLKPFLITLNKYGLHLKDILSGEKNGLDIFLSDDEIGQTFQQIKTLISATKTQQIFHSICQHLQLQYEKQQQTKDNSFQNYRLRIFWLTDSDCSDVLPILDLLLNLSQQTGLLIDIHYADSDPTQLANSQQTFNTYISNQTNLSIIYDETIDLYDSKTLEKISIESFDIIFSANQLLGNQDLTKKNSLIALRRLLVPNGLLLLLELVHVPLYFDLIFCFFDQWWSSDNDNNRALNNIQQWATLLKQIEGFDIIESTLNQNESTLIISQKTISKEILQTLDERKNQTWLIFTKAENNNKNSFSHILSSLLPCSNIRIFDIHNSTLDIICSAISVLLTTYKQVSIIFAWQLDQVLLNENNDHLAFKQNEELICGTLSRILQTIQKSSPHFHPFVYVLTDHAQFNNNSNLNIIASSFIGLARSLITEYERNRLKLIDLQISLNNNNNNKSTFIHTLIEYMINSRYSTDTCEVVLRLNHTNQNQVQHLTWHYEMLQNNNEQEKSKFEQVSIIPKRDADQKPFRLCVPQSRFISELTWFEEDREKELLPGMVEVRVHCAGINFRDVLKSRGLYPHARIFAQSDKNQPKVNQDTEPGSDFVGTIVRVDPTTTNFQVGDHVVGVTGDGAYHSHIMINSQLIIRIPSDSPLTDEQLCGMPTPLLTVIYSLKYRVHLQAGQTVLIHAATGAAGQWCIQYCQYIGARVIATAGTEEKRRFLREYYGIEHVFNSRDASFVNDIRQILSQGVDVIVNSLSGNLLKESIKLLAYHGHFVEWGKRDIYHDNNLSMFQLRSDCSFHVIDFISLADHVSPLMRLMLEEAIDLFIQRKLRAVEPTVTYEPS
ncbi:unnamed protein product, partial [Adineta steineri]